MKEWSTKKWARHGPEHSQWKGGRSIDSKGYIKLNVNLIEPEFHSMCDASGWVLEHRYIVAKSLGRVLTVDELVHHIDHDNSNNVLDNLELTTRENHMRLHASWEMLRQFAHKNEKYIFCHELKQTYKGINKAASELGISRDSIFRSLRDGKSHSKHTFSYREFA